MDHQTNADPTLPMERVLYEVKKVIVGQDHLLERLIVAAARRAVMSWSRASPAWPRR